MSSTQNTSAIGMQPIYTREQIVQLWKGATLGIQELQKTKQEVPEEAAEMLSIFATAVHWMDEAKRLAAGEDRTLRCAFCAQPYPEGTPEAKSETLKQHIAMCDGHPMRPVVLACQAVVDDYMRSKGEVSLEVVTQCENALAGLGLKAVQA